MSENDVEVTGISRAYRSAAGLPERTDGSTIDALEDTPELTKAYEPEGGYGGEGGISNVSAISASEHPGEFPPAEDEESEDEEPAEGEESEDEESEDETGPADDESEDEEDR